MFKLTLGEIASAINAVSTQGDPDRIFTGVSTDSRRIAPGSLFIALKGERFDAHEFAAQAIRDGAAGVMVHRDVPVPASTPLLQVEDTLMGMQKLANYNRGKFKGPLIAVTGSNGKTTTKDLISSVLAEKYRVLKTFGNFNNEIGLPLTLLNLDESYEAAIIEMGMRGLGEIDFLARMAAPTAGVITNVGETHLERLGTVENIARAKTELLPHLPEQGYAILNGDDQWLRKFAHLSETKIIFYGMDENNDIYASGIDSCAGSGSRFKVVYRGESREFYLPVPGRHNIYNALAAIAVGLQDGLSWEQCIEGIKRAVLTGMRLQVIEFGGFKVINDTYNANPVSTKASLGILAEMPAEGRKIAVLGDMYELGDRTEVGHREVGEAAVSLGVDILVAVGRLAKNIFHGARDQGMKEDRVFSCGNNKEALELLRKLVNPGDCILVKGSRGMKMEEIVHGITCELTQ